MPTFFLERFVKFIISLFVKDEEPIIKQLRLKIHLLTILSLTLLIPSFLYLKVSPMGFTQKIKVCVE